MLKIEVIKFEAQDVITTSAPDATCNCRNYCFSGNPGSRYHLGFYCGCDAEVHVHPSSGEKVER